ncbi:neutral ceramidase isoform X1 [Nasonia vitripennis]|uniref:Neutral ceramidase n=2 Tax=Nasonia vitripennis TaxID=7425 RepID=A0A7M7HHT2_NASVI|nr:neutral ceramidase isoform X1 [Nasonia vitripennis]XP_008216624.1 neutral ceramidase isoform X1 [Nasonia vitripennis]XP_008216625.1 neutral ceramidase isoform X1 [Nasonia vitripennis]XP_031783214.1 neutral ceramidase isoform X1 [Nasonia vitripennis]XP_032454550.1 neutral ceramidase isoform X1 [Nasonia vitripennis]XP_032454551.1 neutral ceramidase isoform X1 [Nasonia vitripennis]
MDSLRNRLRPRKCGLIMTSLLIGILVPNVVSSYSIGVGISDTTGPVAEIVFMGYAKMDQKGSGLHLRTFARSFIIDDGQHRFVFVTVDSAMVGHDVKAAVLRNLQSHYGDLYTESNVMISATHTHSAPGGFMMDVLFDISTYGFVKESFTALVNGIAKSIDKAHNAVVPGRIFITRGEVLEANINRSPLAYLNNPEEERNKYKYDVDKDLVQLQFIAANGKPLGVINWFAVHPTSMNNTNHLVSSDNVGFASVLFEKRINKNAMVGKGDFVAAFASTNLGDVSPNTRGPKCEFSGQHCTVQYTCPGKKEMCFASGPGKDIFESTSIIANKILDEAWKLWGSGSVTEVKGPVRIVHRFVDMPKQSATFYNATTQKVEEVHGCLPAMGYSFAAGTTDGPGSFAFEQGTTTSNPFWNTVRNFLAKPTDEDVRCHGAKPILLATGRMKLPYQWQPKIVSTHLALIGNVAIAGVPGEFTTMSGRRLRDTVKTAIVEADKSFENANVILAGLCNTYSDYVATPEEYQLQRYEGASTIFGPHTLTIYLKQYAELAKHAVLDETVEPGPNPPDLSKEKLISLVPPVIYDAPKWGREFGDCVKQPMRTARPGDVVTARFISGHPRNNFMTGSTYLTVERLEEDETWTPVATDADWETKFIWERTSSILGSSQVITSWEVPENVIPGEYRIRHNGYYRYILGGVYPYQGVTNHFQVKTPNLNY